MTKEKLIIPRKVRNHNGELVDNRWFKGTEKVGDIKVSWAAAPGYGKWEEKITRIDKDGIWGVELTNSVRVAEPWEEE